MDENKDIITQFEYFTLTDEEIIEQGKAKRNAIIKQFKKATKEDSGATIYSLIKEEFKYIRLNIENMFTVEGKIKVEYGIGEDGDLGVITIPDILNRVLFRSIYNNSETLLISDVMQEIFNKYKANKHYTYNDTKENYLKEFLNAYSKRIQDVFELLMFCNDDTIEFKKVGNVVQIKTYNTVADDDKYMARELQSKELFDSIENLKPRKYRSLQDIIDTKPFDFNYREIVEVENERIKKALYKSFDEQYGNNPELVPERDRIVTELFEKMKLIYR